MKWYPFDPKKGYHQKRPPIGKYVLVMAASRSLGLPESIAVGYRKDGAGCKDSPYFVVPGLGGDVFAWCDCLPEGFEWPKLLADSYEVVKQFPIGYTVQKKL